tara:strand:- start:438 stop:731 length:294 start_codon:yes stop_codon:yes gene_type:complete
MNKSIAILFLEFRELVSKQIIDLSSTLMRHDFEIRNQKDQLSFLKKQVDDLTEEKFEKPLIDWLIKSISEDPNGPDDLLELLKGLDLDSENFENGAS